MKNLYDFTSRYGETRRLVRVEDNKYILSGIIYSTRVGYNDNDKTNIAFVDPDGGPFLAVGDHLDKDTIINAIEWKDDDGIVITLGDDISSN